MSIVPNELQTMNEDVPGIGGVPPASKTGEALAGLGNAMYQTGLNLLTDIKQVEAHDTANKAYYGDVQAAEEKLTQLKLTSPDGYIHHDPQNPQSARVLNSDGTERTMQQEFADWANKRYQDNQESLPTAMAQNLYKARAGEYFNREAAVLHSEQLARHVESFTVDLEGHEQTLRNNLVSTPDVSKAYSFANDLEKDVRSQTGKLYSPPDAEKKVRAMRANVAESLMEGARSAIFLPVRRDELSGTPRKDRIDRWRAILNGGFTDEQGNYHAPDPDTASRISRGLPTVGDMLAPDKKAEIDRQLIKLYDQAKGLDLSDLSTRLENHKAALEHGTASLGDSAAINKMINDAVRSGDMLPTKAAELRGQMHGAGYAGDLRTDQAFMWGPETYQNKRIQNAQKDTQGAAQTTLGNAEGTQDIGAKEGFERQKAAQDLADKIKGARETDFPDYLFHPEKWVGKDNVRLGSPVQGLHEHLDFSSPMSFDDKRETVQTMIRQTEAAESFAQLNPAFHRMAALSMDDSKALASKLKDPTLSNDTTTQSVLALKKAYGKYFPDLIEQMIKDKQLDEDWRIAGYEPKALQTQDVVQAIRGSTDAEKAFVARGLDPKALEKSLIKNESIQNYVASQVQKDPNETMTEKNLAPLREAVKVKAMQNGIVSGSKSYDDLVKDAADALINKNGHLISAGTTSYIPFGWFGASTSTSKEVSHIFLPYKMGSKTIGDQQAGQITTFLNNHANAEALEAWKILPTKTYESLAKMSNATDMKKQFYKAAGRDVIFTLDAGNRGFNVWLKDEVGTKSFQKARVADGNSTKELFIPIEQVLDGSK